jgi:hypothetical protein
LITAPEMVLVDLGTRVDRLVLKAQQTAAIMEKSLHILQAVELFGLNSNACRRCSSFTTLWERAWVVWARSSVLRVIRKETDSAAMTGGT